MGAKYTTQATAGYDASPPADDGSQVAANLISWSGIKTKLANVLKTFGEAINTALVSAFDYSVRQTSVSDTTVASDHMRCIEIASTVTTAVTIALGDASTMTNVYRVFVKNSSAINQTVARVTGADTIDGVAGNVTLPPKAGAIFQTNNAATGYITTAWFGPFSDGSPVVAGGTDGTKKVRLEVDGLTTATTRVWTARDADFDIGAATQAEQETGSILTASVTPGRQQFHPSAAKGWVNGNFAGGINASYNLTSITDTGTGQVTVTWNVDFSSSNYCTVVGVQSNSNVYGLVDNSTAPIGGAVLVDCRNTGSGALADADGFYAVAFGDQ